MIALTRSRTTPIGLHLGARAATLVQLSGPADRPEIFKLAHGELPNVEQAPVEEQDRETAAALRKLIADHHFRGRNVVSCLGAQELFVQNVRVPQLPAEELAKVVAWEAEERLPYPIAEAELRHILAGKVRQDANVKQEVILLACHQGIVARHLRVLEQAGLTPLAIDIEPCAVLRCLRRAGARADERCAFLSFGDRATTVIFAEGDQILFLKHIACGGQRLDQAVARHMNLSVAEAARMRSTVTAAAELDATDELHRSVIDAIRGPLETIVSEIELCLRYYKVTFRGKPLERAIVTGGEASQWLGEFLTERLATPCQLGNPFQSLAHWPTVPSVLERPWRWTTAMGLSLKA